MNGFLEELARRAVGAAGNVVMFTMAGGVIAGSVAVNALMFDKYVAGTPEFRSLQCMVGIMQPDCPHFRREMERLKGDLASMQETRDALERQLAGLRAVENAVDQVTLFESVTDPTSGREITTGTVYRRIVETAPKPERYYCYIALGQGDAGETRNLYFYTSNQGIWMSPTEAQKAGVSAATLAFAKSVCEPLLIGGGT